MTPSSTSVGRATTCFQGTGSSACSTKTTSSMTTDSNLAGETTRHQNNKVACFLSNSSIRGFPRRPSNDLEAEEGELVCSSPHDTPYSPPALSWPYPPPSPSYSSRDPQDHREDNGQASGFDEVVSQPTRSALPRIVSVGRIRAEIAEELHSHNFGEVSTEFAKRKAVARAPSLPTGNLHKKAKQRCT